MVLEPGLKCGSGEPGSSFCVMMDILYHVPHLCGGFFAIFNELNSKSYDDWVQKEITVNKDTIQLNTDYSKLYVNESLKLAFLQVSFNGSVTGDVSKIITLPVTTKDYAQIWATLASSNGGAYTGRILISQSSASIICVGGTVTNPFANILFPIR